LLLPGRESWADRPAFARTRFGAAAFIGFAVKDVAGLPSRRSRRLAEGRAVNLLQILGFSRRSSKNLRIEPRRGQGTALGTIHGTGRRRRLAHTKGPQVRAPVRGPALRIVAATAEFLSAPSPRAFDLLQEAEPYLKEIRAGFVCCHGFADLFRPNPTAARYVNMVDNWLPKAGPAGPRGSPWRPHPPSAKPIDLLPQLVSVPSRGRPSA